MILRRDGARTALLGACGVLAVLGGAAAFVRRQEADTATPLPTGKRLAPQGAQTPVGSFPANMALSPDGRWIAVTNTGYRENLSILSAADGHLVSQIAFNAKEGDEGDKSSLYYGLAFSPAASAGSTTLYASRGPQDKISVFTVDGDGKLADAGRELSDPSGLPAAAKAAQPNFIAGLALSADGSHLYSVHNETSAYTDQKGSVSILDTASGSVLGKVTMPGFPLAVAAVTKGANADKKLYVSSERDGCVSDIDVHAPAHAAVVRDIKTGDHPMALLLDRAQERLFVANASSDTVSVVSTADDRVLQTLSVRGRSHLPGVTPSGLALSPDESRLYVTLADENAVAVVGLSMQGMRLLGTMPAGWYPTSVVAAPDGKQLFVANAKGVQPRNPNGAAVGPDGAWGQYIENIIEGTVATLATPADSDLNRLTALVDAANEGIASAALPKTGIRHVIYIIKENRTYDQVLGDLPQGNGDSRLTLFGREVTPNLHALAERFVLLDNFYCSAEVSADGWNWSTSGMGSEYAERNVPFNYSGRGRDYDYEGATNGTPVDLMHLPDVARAPGGYLWDAVAKKGLTYRDYGFFNAFSDLKAPDGKLILKENQAQERALVGHTDTDFLRFNLDYADSDAYRIDNCPTRTQRLTYGSHDAPDRFAEWKREFDGYVKEGNLPAFEMVRFGRDHTSGTKPGVSSPRAMVADNDYAVGQLVEAVSKSPYWKETAIFVVEDDAQNGYDHVDAHRSIAFVISPYVEKGSVDHHFYNTDSTLHTMETLLGLPPMCRYDATAPVFQAFRPHPENDAPYTALLPAREVVAEVNRSTAYRAAESGRLDFSQPDRVPDDVLNDIVWHSVKGATGRALSVKR
jgi:DNA-binding beta-propeller fold protein YncE